MIRKDLYNDFEYIFRNKDIISFTLVDFNIVSTRTEQYADKIGEVVGAEIDLEFTHLEFNYIVKYLKYLWGLSLRDIKKISFYYKEKNFVIYI